MISLNIFLDGVLAVSTSVKN